MSLRSKIVLSLCSVAVLWAAVDRLLLRSLVTRHFQGLGERAAVDALSRGRSALEFEQRRVRDAGLAFASSGVLQDALRELDSQGLLRATADELLEGLGLDLFLVIGSGGVVHRRFSRDAEGAPASYRMFASDALAPTNPMFKQSESERFGSILPTEHGLLVTSVFAIPLAGRPAQPLEDVVPVPANEQAVVVVGRLMQASRQVTAFELPVEVALRDVTRTSADERVSLGLDEFEPERLQAAPLVRTIEGEKVQACQILDDLEGKPTILLAATLEPDEDLRGRGVQQYLALSTIGTATLIFVVLLRLLQRAVVAPLTALTRHAVEIGRTDDTTRRLSMEREDEIGQLSAEFDRMLDKLEESRRLLVVSARQAGMSDVATGVLHNVGNVLNSVNVSRSLLEKRLEELAVEDVGRVVDVLREHADDLPRFVSEDPRGQNLVPFLGELARTLSDQRARVRAELESLRKGVDHVADLVRSQQAYAGSRGVFEPSVLAVEIENALKITVQAYGDDLELEVLREFEDVPNVSVDRHKLMEILINLVQNAKQAMRAVEHPQLTLGLRQTSAGRVEIRVSDNGIGIPPEDLTRVFRHGFTTKQDGHGFGLHVSANAATELGAQLDAHSNGAGMGATFVLSFPAPEAAASDKAAA